MNPNEFRNRVNQMLAEDRKHPMAWWYLSFADTDGWRGGAFIKAHGPTEALYIAKRRGVSPGGEVCCVKCPDSEVPTEDYCHRLLTKAEIEAYYGTPMMTLQECKGEE